MDQATWNRMTPAEKNRARDLSGLTPQLCGLEGWRVEVISETGETRRFNVGRSTGWRPCHLELTRANVRGGSPAAARYASVRALRKID